MNFYQILNREQANSFEMVVTLSEKKCLNFIGLFFQELFEVIVRTVADKIMEKSRNSRKIWFSEF